MDRTVCRCGSCGDRLPIEFPIAGWPEFRGTTSPDRDAMGRGNAEIRPACGAAFEPYGPVELGFITSLISQAALDCLLGSIGSATHRIWLARRSVLESASGQWSQAIRLMAPHALDGGTILERRWGQLLTVKV